MNRYRFYQIIQAHKNGEDLSAFVPKNAPEAELIAALQGGSGGGAEIVYDKTYSAGTVIPNYGTIERIYFNTALSVDEVKAITSQLYFNPDFIPDVFVVGDDNAHMIVISPSGKIYDWYNGTVYFSVSGDWVGWNPEIFSNKNYVELNIQAVSSSSTGSYVGNDNYALTSLLSTTPFEIIDCKEVELNGTYDGDNVSIVDYKSNDVDLSKYISGGKIPMNISVFNNSNLNRFLTEDPIPRIEITITEQINRLLEYTFAYKYVDYIKVIDKCRDPLSITNQFLGCNATTVILQKSGLGELHLSKDAFLNNIKLKNLVLVYETIYVDDDEKIDLTGTPIAEGTGYIYVNEYAVDLLKEGAFSNYADQVKSVSEYVEE